ncbi:MAG TPA: polyprenol monophosphomannose synthase [bacterium]|nr:polyprenol monophosphomannose synthase [bacterium]
MRTGEKTLIIIPTYNEVGNIEKLIPLVLKQNPGIEVLVIDDSSPDGTAKAVKNVMARTERIHLIERHEKLGLGTAYVTGFQYALQKKYDLIFEMDADFSHDPKEIPRFLDKIKDHDLVIGSRYIRGVNVVNWPISRLLLSWAANRYTRIVTGLPVKDATSGYKCFRREVLESIDLSQIHSDGYAFQIEMHFKVWEKGFRILEIPIVFVDRYEGDSKMNPGIVREAAWMVWKLRFLSLFRRL